MAVITKTSSLFLEKIAKEFPQREGRGTVTAVDHISLTIKEGEFVTLLGPSGCGKTTTLRIVSGFEIPTSGRVLLDDKEITNLPPNKRDMAMVFQSYALFPHMTVFNNIAYGLRIHRLPRKQIRENVERVLDLMSLTGLASRRPHELSGGQQQRVALARSLVVEPRVLLFDEPLSNLDAKLRVQMRSEIRNLQRRLNITSVYVTHDQTEAMALSDRIVVMNQGQIEQIGSPEEIYRYPRSRFVADFIGRANFVETQVESVRDHEVTVGLLGRTLSLPAQFAANPGAAVTVIIRPEALRLQHDLALPQVRVEQAMYLGSSIEYVVEQGNNQLTVVEMNPHIDRLIEEGAMVGIDFDSASIHLLPSDGR